MNDIDDFVEYVIKELCEGCTECEPKLDSQWTNVICVNQGKVQWLLDLKERFKNE